MTFALAAVVVKNDDFTGTGDRNTLALGVGLRDAVAGVETRFRGLGARAVVRLDGSNLLFFGLALQLYQMTLISDDAPIDRDYYREPTSWVYQDRRDGHWYLHGLWR